MSKRSAGNEWRLFFNAALLNDFLHGRLSAAAIHVGSGIANLRRRTGGTGEQESWVSVFAPQSAQSAAGEVGQWHQAVLVALAAADMDLVALGIDIADFKSQGFTQAQTHGVGSQEEHAVAQFAGGADQAFDFGEGEDIRQCLELGGLDNPDPGPVAFEDMFVEELQAVAVNFYGTPGVGLDKIGEVGGQLLGAEVVGATLEVLRDTADGTGIGIDGFVAFALQFQGSEVAFVQFVEAGLVFGIHDKLHCHCTDPGLGQQEWLYMNSDFYCRVAASFNKAMNTVRKTAVLFCSLHRCALSAAGYRKRWASCPKYSQLLISVLRTFDFTASSSSFSKG